METLQRTATTTIYCSVRGPATRRWFRLTELLRRKTGQPASPLLLTETPSRGLLGIFVGKLHRRNLLQGQAKRTNPYSLDR